MFLWKATSQSSKGVTIIELIIAVAISSLLIGAVVSAYIISLRIFSQQTGQIDVFWDGQRAADVMGGEIRESYSILSPGAQSLTFWWKDLNGNGNRETDETITYSLSGQNLMRSIGANSRSLAGNVVSLNFNYDNLLSPKLVNISLTLNHLGKTATVESRVRIRNAI